MPAEKRKVLVRERAPQRVLRVCDPHTVGGADVIEIDAEDAKLVFTFDLTDNAGQRRSTFSSE